MLVKIVCANVETGTIQKAIFAGPFHSELRKNAVTRFKLQIFLPDISHIFQIPCLAERTLTSAYPETPTSSDISATGHSFTQPAEKSPNLT